MSVITIATTKTARTTELPRLRRPQSRSKTTLARSFAAELDRVCEITILGEGSVIVKHPSFIPVYVVVNAYERVARWFAVLLLGLP